MVLIVDDDEILVEIIKDILEINGFVGKCLHGGHAAISWLDHGHDCELVITDLQMLNGSGFDLLTWIQANRPELKVIIVTGTSKSEMHETEQFGELVHIPVVSKPFTGDKLISVIDKVFVDN